MAGRGAGRESSGELYLKMGYPFSSTGIQRPRFLGISTIFP